eukprot:g4003.t1
MFLPMNFSSLNTFDINDHYRFQPSSFDPQHYQVAHNSTAISGDNGDSNSTSSDSAPIVGGRPQYFMWIVICIVYMILWLTSISLMARIIYYRHRFLSFQGCFLLIVFLWTGLRVLFWMDTKTTNPKYIPMSLAIYWVPNLLQFTMFSLLATFYAKILHFAKWRKKRANVFCCFLASNILFTVVTGIWLALIYLDNQVKTLRDLYREIDFCYSLFSGIVFGTLMVVVSTFAWRVYKMRMQHRMTIQQPFASTSAMAGLTFLVFLVFMTRCAYGFLQAAGGWILFPVPVAPRGDRLTPCVRGVRLVDYPTFVLLLVWEVLPTVAMLIFFRRIPKSKDTLLKRYSACCCKKKNMHNSEVSGPVHDHNGQHQQHHHTNSHQMYNAVAGEQIQKSSPNNKVENSTMNAAGTGGGPNLWESSAATGLLSNMASTGGNDVDTTPLYCHYYHPPQHDYRYAYLPDFNDNDEQAFLREHSCCCASCCCCPQFCVDFWDSFCSCGHLGLEAQALARLEAATHIRHQYPKHVYENWNHRGLMTGQQGQGGGGSLGKLKNDFENANGVKNDSNSNGNCTGNLNGSTGGGVVGTSGDKITMNVISELSGTDDANATKKKRWTNNEALSSSTSSSINRGLESEAKEGAKQNGTDKGNLFRPGRPQTQAVIDGRTRPSIFDNKHFSSDSDASSWRSGFLPNSTRGTTGSWGPSCISSSYIEPRDYLYLSSSPSTSQKIFPGVQRDRTGSQTRGQRSQRGHSSALDAYSAMSSLDEASESSMYQFFEFAGTPNGAVASLARSLGGTGMENVLYGSGVQHGQHLIGGRASSLVGSGRGMQRMYRNIYRGRGHYRESLPSSVDEH